MTKPERDKILATKCTHCLELCNRLTVVFQSIIKGAPQEFYSLACINCKQGEAAQ